MLNLEKYKDLSFTLAPGVVLCKGNKHNLILLGDKVFQIMGSGYDVLTYLQDRVISSTDYINQIHENFAAMEQEDEEFLSNFIEKCIQSHIILTQDK